MESTIKKTAFAPTFLLGLFLFGTSLIASGCDRGATEQVQAAERFAESIVKNNTTMRDSMIATRLFRKHFQNDFVARDLINLMQSIYDTKTSHFVEMTHPRADVDHDLKAELSGGLIYEGAIEETGMVRVKSPGGFDTPTYFWMVRQAGHHWMVAMITKGEAAVNFRN
ncbi:MAG: hypothetical protein WCH46_07445 [bacterium]